MNVNPYRKNYSKDINPYSQNCSKDINSYRKNYSKVIDQTFILISIIVCIASMRLAGLAFLI